VRPAGWNGGQGPEVPPRDALDPEHLNARLLSRSLGWSIRDEPADAHIPPIAREEAHGSLQLIILGTGVKLRFLSQAQQGLARLST